jgi:hypothetical protein
VIDDVKLVPAMLCTRGPTAFRQWIRTRWKGGAPQNLTVAIGNATVFGNALERTHNVTLYIRAAPFTFDFYDLNIDGIAMGVVRHCLATKGWAMRIGGYKRICRGIAAAVALSRQPRCLGVAVLLRP